MDDLTAKQSAELAVQEAAEQDGLEKRRIRTYSALEREPASPTKGHCYKCHTPLLRSGISAMTGLCAACRVRCSGCKAEVAALIGGYCLACQIAYKSGNIRYAREAIARATRQVAEYRKDARYLAGLAAKARGDK